MSIEIHNIQEILHKRILATLKIGSSYHSELKEFKVLEISPSDLFAKIMDLHGNKRWISVSDITIIEVLAQLETKREENKELQKQGNKIPTVEDIMGVKMI